MRYCRHFFGVLGSLGNLGGVWEGSWRLIIILEQLGSVLDRSRNFQDRKVQTFCGLYGGPRGGFWAGDRVPKLSQNGSGQAPKSF